MSDPGEKSGEESPEMTAKPRKPVQYLAAAVNWVVEMDCLVLLPAGSPPVRLHGADAALWALLVRGHSLAAIVNMMTAVTGEADDVSAPHVKRLLALWEEKGYVSREAANG